MAATHRGLTSLVRGRLLRLPPPHTRDVIVERDLQIPMSDGVILLADRYIGVRPGGDSTSAARNGSPGNGYASNGSSDNGYASNSSASKSRTRNGRPSKPRARDTRTDNGRTAAEHPPTVLIRTPYGRTGTWSLLYGPVLAERGFQVIIQSVRGTAGSGGQFVPRHQERDDGLATVRWIREQPWFGGQLAAAGMSYLGYAVWAIADEAELDAVVLQATMPSLVEPLYDGGAFALGIALPWTAMINRAQPILSRLLNRFSDRELHAGLGRLPLTDGDQATLGRHVGYYQDWLSHGPDDPYWTAQSHTHRVASLTSPVSMRTGWYDVYLPWMLRDYAALCAAGNPPRLTIGPWAHVSPGLLRGIPRETVDFLSEHLLDAPPRSGGQVRYHVTGADEWRDAETWPPPGGRDQRWSLGAAGELTLTDSTPISNASTDSAPTSNTPTSNTPTGGTSNGSTPNGHAPINNTPIGSTPTGATPTGGTRVRSASMFRYDPTDPTPSVGGPTMLTDETSVDNRELEHRSDVLVFTSLPLLADVDVIGTPQARLSVSADNRHHDVFVQLCDVHPDGSSMNVSGRLIRLDDVEPGPDGVREAALELWPAAHRFAAGHRIRVQVSGGAHPRYARNLGTGEPLATATRTVPSTIAVHHDAHLTSTITLPVYPA